VSRSRRYKGRAQEDLLETEQIIAEMESQLDETQARMEQELAHILGREVDLLTRRPFEKSHNWIRRQQILDTADVVYASR